MKPLRLLCAFLIYVCAILSSVTGQNKISVNFNAEPPELKVVKVVQLETNKETFFDRSFRVKVSDRYIFVQDKHQILIFDQNGKYLSKVKRLGHGPQEYIGIEDFCWNNNELYVLPFEGGKIQVYSLQGGFVRSMILKVQAEAFFLTDKLKFFKTFDKRGSLIVANERGKKVMQKVSPIMPRTTFSITSPQPFTQIEDRIYYLPDFRSEIYQIHPSGQELQILSLDFGSHTITPEYVAKLEQRSLFDQLKKDKVACFLNFHPTSQWYGLVFSMGGQVYRWFYNLQSGKQYMSEVKDGLTSKLIVSSTDDCFVEAVDALDFLENPRFAEYRKGRTVEEGDNAVLIFYTVE